MRIFKGKLSDSVQHPTHYNFGQIEVIDVIEDWQMGFHLGNAVKYLARAGKKDPKTLQEDLNKAIWYIERHMEYVSQQSKPNIHPTNLTSGAIDIKP